MDITFSPNLALVFFVRIHPCFCFTIEVPCKILHIRESALRMLTLLLEWIHDNPWPEPWTYQESEPLSRPSYAEPGLCVWSTRPEHHWARAAVLGCTADLVAAAQDHVLTPRILNTVMLTYSIIIIKYSYHMLYKPPWFLHYPQYSLPVINIRV